MLMLKPLRSLVLYFLETGSWQVDIAILGQLMRGGMVVKTGGGFLPRTGLV